MKKRLGRMLAMLLCLSMLISLLAVPAFAVEEGEESVMHALEGKVSTFASEVNEVYDSASEIEADFADGEEVTFIDDSRAVAYLREQMRIRETEIIVYTYKDSLYSTEEKQQKFIADLIESALAAKGYLYYTVLGYSCEYVYQEDSGYSFFGIALYPVYLTSAEEEEIIAEQVNLIRNELHTGALTTEEQLYVVYDYITENIEYVAETEENLGDIALYSPYLALVNGRANSYGIALLMTKFSLGVTLVEGTKDGLPHLWLAVKAYGKHQNSWENVYYYMDAACDSGTTERAHFLKCAATMSDHIPDLPLSNLAKYDFGVVYEIASGQLGDAMPWTLNSEGEFTLSGAGDIPKLDTYPWANYLGDLTYVVIGEGITSIPGTAFYGAKTLSFTLPQSLKEIESRFFDTSDPVSVTFLGEAPELGENTFYGCRVFVYYPDHMDSWVYASRKTYNARSITWIGTSGHTWNEWEVTQESTCEETGLQVRVCTDCGKTQEYILEPIGHYYTYTSYAPTCTEQGYRLVGCIRCDYSEKDSFTDPLGHSWDEGVIKVAPTETKDGEIVYTCTRCAETKAEIAHNYISEVHDPTCEEQGYTEHVCSACGHNYEDAYVSALGHIMGEMVIVKEPTETEPGLKQITCQRCGETVEKYIPYITRIAGAGRCDTALKAADTLKAKLGVETFDSIIIASGNNFADALAGSYLASVKNAPILLYQASFVQNNLDYVLANLTPGGTVYLLGGEAAVPADVEEGLVAAGLTVKRLSGAGRFDTNLAILEEAGVASGQEILIATGYNYADSLSASATGLPMLLVDSKKDKLTDAQIEFLESLGSTKLTILGGTGAVGTGLEKELRNYGEVERLAGAGREETSTLIAETYFDEVDTVLIAYSRNFPDGLSGGPLAYAMDAPLVLTRAGAETAAAAYVADNPVTAGYVLGGTGAVSDATVSKVFDLD